MPFAQIRPDELAGPRFVESRPDARECVVCGPGGHFAHCPAGGAS